MNDNLSSKKSSVHQKIGNNSGLKRMRSGQKTDINSATKPASGIKKTSTTKMFDPVLQNVNNHKKINARSPNNFK